MRQVIVEISRDGEVTIKAIGFKGSACEKATAAIEKALGGQVTSRKRTPDYYQGQGQQQQQGQG